MDPSEIICEERLSFLNQKKIDDLCIQNFFSNTPINYNSEFNFINIDNFDEIIYDHSEDILHQLIDIKNNFDTVERNSFTQARTKSNPFEKIGNSVFMNRAAVK